MYRIIITLISIFLLFNSAWGLAAEVDSSNPYSMVEQVARNTFSRLTSEREQIKQDPLLINKVVEQELIPYLDYRFAALKILGKYYRQYPLEKINQYTEVFKTYSASVFANALHYYQDQAVEFEPAREFNNQKQTTVRLNINQGSNSINLAFVVRKDTKTEQWRVYDVVAEGISMLSSLQSQFEPILRKEGIEAVMKTMRNTKD
ncbi:phospholipid-binding protein MlaC [Paraglaciecola sp.]|uniref:MlaC/ttg2D family ABC transporter substrate-binding protein n=1 Tax=Paraglaciecola sp. TaxID=1920173 RepID=UPI0027402C96|nr:ABC transporter substrate-binding protein [Paraglaciecola sp.]MDP5029182.1 ABC transporter substrate-binding protein [Paraglaciecola sp.]